MEDKDQSFLGSYLVANRIAGYLIANKILKASSVDQEAGVICEFAGQIREVTTKMEISGGLLQYHNQYGLAGVIEALKFDIRVRGSEWEMIEKAKNILQMLNSFVTHL
jgi:hypothetical protein